MNTRGPVDTAGTSERPEGVSQTTTLFETHSPNPPSPAQHVPELVWSDTKPPLEREDASVLVVDWDGPDDPQNPKNWSLKKKWGITLIVSGFTFISPISSSMVAPASEQIASEFGIHSTVTIALITSIFVLAFAVGPLFLAPLSEIYGRSRVLQLANLWYFAWNLGCGFAQNESQLLAFRFLAGIGGSAPLASGGGVLSDCWRTEERGQAMAVYSLAPLLGPVIGPITGAWIAERSTWRWVFWSTCIVNAFVQFLGLIYLKETYPPLLLERKAERIRRSMDAEKAPNREVQTVYYGKEDHSWKEFMAKALVRPFALFFQEPIIQLLGAYMAYLYGLMYLFLTTMTSVFQGAYHQSVGIAGLNYIAFGMGMTVAAQIGARTLDGLYIRLKDRNEGIGRPEFRLPAMFIGTMILPIGLFITGWTSETSASWVATDIGILLIGAGVILSFMSIQTYIIDTFTLYAASALAAVSFLRSIAGFGFPLFAPSMYSALGFGVGDTILAVVAIVIGGPAPWIFWHFGERIRNASRHARR